MLASARTERNALEDNKKYIGMDVHKETISVPVLSSSGKLVMESLVETKLLTVAQLV